jgi:signal transduction histidine kinase
VLRDGDQCHYVDEDAIGPLWKGRRFPMSACISGWAMLHRTPAVVDDITHDERIPIEAYRPTFVKSLALVPIRAADPIGAIGVYWASRHRAGEDELTLLQELADTTALALENVALYGALDESRQRAEAASDLKDQFLATVSHELRTPMNAIVGWTSLMAQGTLDGDELREAAVTVLRSARAQTKLIDDLLDISQLVSGKTRLALATIDAVPVIEFAIAEIAPLAAQKRVRVRASLDPACGRMCADPARLRQIAWNLLSNAVKFTPVDGEVHIALARHDAEVELCVADTGDGIAPEFLPHVFDRFRQEDGSSTRRAGGMGLGLAFVRHLAELHGGSVRAESPGKGAGAKFTVTLPLG